MRANESTVVTLLPNHITLEKQRVFRCFVNTNNEAFAAYHSLCRSEKSAYSIRANGSLCFSMHSLTSRNRWREWILLSLLLLLPMAALEQVGNSSRNKQLRYCEAPARVHSTCVFPPHHHWMTIRYCCCCCCFETTISCHLISIYSTNNWPATGRLYDALEEVSGIYHHHWSVITE